MMTGQEKKGKYVYYSHDCASAGKFLYIKEADILDAIETKIRAAHYSPDFAENLKLLFRNVGENQSRGMRSELDELANKEETLAQKKGRLYDLYADEDLDRTILKERIDIINLQMKKLEAYRGTFTAGYDKAIVQICDVIDELRDRPAAALTTIGEEKAAMLRSMIETVELDGAAWARNGDLVASGDPGDDELAFAFVDGQSGNGDTHSAVALDDPENAGDVAGGNRGRGQETPENLGGEDILQMGGEQNGDGGRSQEAANAGDEVERSGDITRKTGHLKPAPRDHRILWKEPYSLLMGARKMHQAATSVEKSSRSQRVLGDRYSVLTMLSR